jgi:hypothetical protein
MSRTSGASRVGVSPAAWGDDPSITDEQWAEGARKHFSGRIIVGKDLMEV